MDAAPLRAVLTIFGAAALAALATLALPLALLLLNGLRVRNCAYLTGLSFFAIMPVASSLCAAALGTACGLATRRRLLGPALAVLGVLLSLAWAGQRFLGSPAIYAYDPFFGYFPGALYDEEVAIHAPFLAARLTHAAWIAAALCLCALLLRGRGLTLALPPWRQRRGLLCATLILLALAVGLRLRQGALGVYRDAAAIEDTLSAERRTAHFVLRYTPGGAVSREIDLIAREHELRYQQLRETLGVEPLWRHAWLGRLLHFPNRHEDRLGRPVVVSYLFESAAQKQSLMGAAGTYIAKPWRREIYLQHEAWPHPVLKHELAHVFLGAAGDRLLRLSMHGALPNQGMIEGAAVAADWRGGRLSGHQAVKAMREARLEPPPQAIFGLSFLTVSSGRAYAVAGSFCRYLLDKAGPAPLLAAYRDGGSPEAFARAYGAPFAQLVRDWRAFIDAQALAPRDREVERERVRRPAVFHKVCAHEVAVRKQRAREAAGRGDLPAATALLDGVCRDDPGEPRHLLELMDLRWAGGDYAAAAATAQQLLDHPGGTPALAARAEALLGDVRWVQGRPDEADRHYRRAQELPADESLARLLVAKRWALSPARGEAGREILRVLVGGPDRDRDRDSALDLLALHEAAAALQDEGLPRYLLGRQLLNRGATSKAAAAFAESLRLGLPDPRFTIQAARLRGQALLRAEDTQGAQEVLRWLRDTLLKGPGEEGARLEVEDWIARARAWTALAADAASR
jgi:tetratricopeptide (TPR) repeat protein